MSYCDIPEFFSETKQRARRVHRCCECYKKILIGESYWKSTGKWGGNINSYNQHTWCRAACTNLSDNNYDGCIAFGEMFDAFGDYCWSDKNKKEPKSIKLRKHMARVKWEARKASRQWEDE